MSYRVIHGNEVVGYDGKVIAHATSPQWADVISGVLNTFANETGPGRPGRMEIAVPTAAERAHYRYYECKTCDCRFTVERAGRTQPASLVCPCCDGSRLCEVSGDYTPQAASPDSTIAPQAVDEPAPGVDAAEWLARMANRDAFRRQLICAALTGIAHAEVDNAFAAKNAAACADAVLALLDKEAGR